MEWVWIFSEIIHICQLTIYISLLLSKCSTKEYPVFMGIHLFQLSVTFLHEAHVTLITKLISFRVYSTEEHTSVIFILDLHCKKRIQFPKSPKGTMSLSFLVLYCIAIEFKQCIWFTCCWLEIPVSLDFRLMSLLAFTPWKALLVDNSFYYISQLLRMLWLVNLNVKLFLLPNRFVIYH